MKHGENTPHENIRQGFYSIEKSVVFVSASDAIVPGGRSSDSKIWHGANKI